MNGTLAQRYHGWDNRAKQRLEKSGLKVNKKVGQPVRSTNTTASLYEPAHAKRGLMAFSVKIEVFADSDSRMFRKNFPENRFKKS